MELQTILFSSAGVAVALTVAAKLLPNAKVNAAGRALGRALSLPLFALGKTLSLNGRVKFGKVAWEKIENFIENSIGQFGEGFFAEFKPFDSLKQGLDVDDAE